MKPYDYCPDNWVVAKLNVKDDPTQPTDYRVICGWSGGYLSGNYWRINSGIVSVEEDDQYFYFIGATKSVYKCHKESYMLRHNASEPFYALKERYKKTFELMDKHTDWKSIEYHK